MRRVFAIVWFMFSFHWSVLAVTTIGIVLLLPGLIAGLLGSGWFFAGAGLFFLAFPVIWSGASFRQLVSNRRFALLPHFRSAAVAALLLIALTGGYLASLITAAGGGVASIPSAIDAGLYWFSIFSTQLLLQQWLCTFRIGVILQMALLLLMLRFAELGVSLEVSGSLLLTLGAALGWLGLWLGIRRRTELAGPNPAQSLDRWNNQATGIWGFAWLPAFQFGRPAHPDGSLMRGGNDSWLNRLLSALFCVFGFTIVFMAFMFIVGGGSAESAGPGTGSLTNLVKLIMQFSFFTVAIGAPMLIAEWPIRLRYVWLRSGGSRGALWQQLERAIWHELALLATIVALVSALGAGIAGIEPMLAIAYLAGTMTGMAFSSYLGFSLRIEGTSTMTMSFLLFLIFTPVTWIILYRTLSGQWLWLYPVIGVFAALTLLCRWHARRRFLEVDWCAVRPQRPVNSPALRAREL